MPFSSFDAVLLAIGFLVPGFVWEGVRQLFVRRREERAHQAWIRFLTLSAFNYGVCHIPTAWDHVFSQLTESWVLVTLSDGSTLAGVFSHRSFASSARTERDLFLQRVYRVEDDRPWQPVAMSSGVWIHGQAIRTIEFFEFQE